MTEDRKLSLDALAQEAVTVEVTDERLEAAAEIAASAHVTSMWGHC